MSSEIRVGMIGFDTSHCEAFARILNVRDYEFHIPGCRVVGGVPAGSPDLPASANRVEQYTKILTEQYDLKRFDHIEQMLEQVDAVLLESVDGRVHLEQARPVIAAKKRLFVDKPLAACFDDALAISQLADAAGIEIYSGSSSRWDQAVQDELKRADDGEVLGCDTTGPCRLEPTNPGFFWYGIHGVELLYTLMGPGCESVSCISSEHDDMASGRWADGRIGTFRGLRRFSSWDYTARLHREKTMIHVGADNRVPKYALLMQQVVGYFKSGISPVPMVETLEIMAFMQAALQSSQQGGREMVLRKC